MKPVTVVAFGPDHLDDEDLSQGIPQFSEKGYRDLLREMHTDSDTVQAADIDTLRDLFARTLAKAQGLPSKSIFAKAFNPSILPRCATSRFQRLRPLCISSQRLLMLFARDQRRYQDKDAQEFEAAFKTTFSLGERIKNASPRFKDSNKFVTYRCAAAMALLPLVIKQQRQTSPHHRFSLPSNLSR